MNVLACIDSSRYAVSVCDHAAWAAQRLDVPVELLHVLERHAADPVIAPDRSGRLGVDSREALLQQLVDLDERRNRLSQEAGRHLLDEAAARVRAGGIDDIHLRLVHGELVDHIHDHEADARLIVVGRRGEAEDRASQHLGRNLERLIRASHRPIVIAAQEFRPVERFLVAYDGGASAERAVDALVRYPILADAKGHVLMAGEGTSTERDRLASVTARLREAGYSITDALQASDPDHIIPAAVEEGSFDLLVMGAYGHSRIRTLMIGSTTTALLRATSISMLVMR